MYEEDTDGKVLNSIETIAEEVENFKAKIIQFCSQIISEGLLRLQELYIHIVILNS